MLEKFSMEAGGGADGKLLRSDSTAFGSGVTSLHMDQSAAELFNAGLFTSKFDFNMNPATRDCGEEPS